MTIKNQMQQFYNDEFGSIEILMIDSKPYFPATDCAKILGYSNTNDAITRHCKGVVKHAPLTKGGRQTKNYIPEGDLYRLIIRSNLPAAIRFETWIFDELLPTIRKYGVQFLEKALNNALAEAEKNQELADELFSDLQDEKFINEVLTDFAAGIYPKAKYCELVLKAENSIPVSLIAKDYGMTAAAFNKLLHNMRIQFRMGKTWVLYQTYAKKGYTQTKTVIVDNKTVSVYTQWTQAGRLFLYDMLKSRNILPLCEREEQISIF